jgi:hypothetical protein
VLGMADDLVGDAPDSPPGTKDVVAHSPGVAQGSSPNKCE